MIPITLNQLIVFGILFFSLVLFINGRFRYDVVALLGLCIATILGVVPWNQAFYGFANPAVITVAAVLIISRGLLNAGVVELLTGFLYKAGNRPTFQVSVLTGLVITFSAFMNNVGALALLMPVGLKMARKSLVPASILLLPLAFGSQLGGMITLIGTPPNLIISAFRQEHLGQPYGMFDFSPVGIGVSLVAFLFMAIIGWRLIPKRTPPGSRDDFFNIHDYITEIRVTEESKYAGKSLREIVKATNAKVTIVQLIRGGFSRPVPYMYERIKSGDILIVQSALEDLKAFLNTTGFILEEHADINRELIESGDTILMEATIKLDSPAIGSTVKDIDLRAGFGVNLLAVSRQGVILRQRLNEIMFQAGDVLLLQGTDGTLREAIKVLGCFPLAERGLKIGSGRIIEAVGIFAIAIIIAAMGLVPVQIIFTIAALIMVMVSLVPVREIYESIDWPVIILLGAFIPVGQAMEDTGGAELIASTLLSFKFLLTPVTLLVILLIVTMFLSALINNAATAVLMAPISYNIATGLAVSPDPFLMAIVVGASSSFLTPVGHQSNALVMGPSGLRFGDYWKLGLPLEIVIVIVTIPLILYFWPM
ncbi:SLC13 family permease [Methanospirillum stamsii]|uniref:SLC13 family permease n=1 Tax=Methanospirillum stamsii TaxID=1277351 RepID=A0A2V2MTU3_9EURY|nr:SLC13 family permease [Methanospirillum stamsii]PWR69750.1 SLC13 family permease [Methanospirillum stamsii]